MKTKKMNAVVSLLLVFAAFCMMGCSNAEQKIKAGVEACNENCPMNLGDVGSMESVTYEDGCVVYSFLLNEGVANIEALEAHPELAKESMKAMVNRNDKNTAALIELIKESDSKMKFVLSDGTKSTEIVLSAEELDEALNTEVSPLEKLQMQIDITRAQMPLDDGSGIIITDLLLEDDNVIYVAQVNEDLLSIDDIITNAEAVHDNILDMAKQVTSMANSPEAAFMKIVVENEKNLAYRYVGSKSGKQIDVCLTVEELKQLIIY